ncbi:hypothetical protein UlMin_002720 [Ulmus minor]
MDVGRRRSGVKSSVVAGSVWESRMKIDEVSGGIKVFNGEESSEERNGVSGLAGSRLKKAQINGGGGLAVSSSGKRKTWKSESFEGFERSPTQISKTQKNSDEQLKSPVQGRKLRSEEKIERSPIGMRKQRSELLKSSGDLGELRKAKSSSGKVPVQSNKDVDDGAQSTKEKLELESESELGKGIESIDVSIDEIEKISVENEKNGSDEIEKIPVENEKNGSDEIEKIPVENEKNGSDENCKEFGVCEEELISGDVGLVKSATNAVVVEDDEEEEEMVEEGEEEIEVEIEIEKKSIDIKEIKTPEPEPEPEPKPKPKPKPNKVINGEKVVKEIKKLQFERKVERKIHQVHQKQPEPISINVKKQPPVIKRATVQSRFNVAGPAKSPSTAASHECHSFQETHSSLQSFVDLIMWKDISRSVFIFGIGTFIILSSSYTKDLNISFISVISYLGLVYLAAIFLFRSIVYRGVIEVDNTNYVVGEGEAIWLLKLILPYLNEFLLKLKALFSGDPSTTMKLAVLLFVLARCGSSITIWTMAKLSFFGVFTLPKVCSLYSTQITAYAKFWVRRFRDAWDSCSHKKAVTVAVFLLVWNLSSIVARIWAVFMLYVAFRYYQQNLVTDDWVEEDAGDEDTWYEPIDEQKQGFGPTVVDNNKLKKRS